MPLKLCECGCGKPAPIAKVTRKNRGQIRGEPIRFIRYHHNKLKKLEESTSWKSGVTCSNGYKKIKFPTNMRAEKSGYVSEHILIAEKILEKPLPKNAVLHHFDGDTLNNSNNNLVICENQAYHLRLHKRKRAYDACGNANWLKCRFCSEWDDPKNMYVFPNEHKGYHRECYTKKGG